MIMNITFEVTIENVACMRKGFTTVRIPWLARACSVGVALGKAIVGDLVRVLFGKLISARSASAFCKVANWQPLRAAEKSRGVFS